MNPKTTHMPPPYQTGILLNAPTPWHLEASQTSIIDSDGLFVADIVSTSGEKQKRANAAHIVKCVNLHDELVMKVEFLQTLIDELMLPPDCRPLEHAATDFSHVKFKTEDLLNKVKAL